MTGPDPDQAAHQLATAEEHLRRGAQLAAPARWWKPALLLFLVMLGVSRDVPSPGWRAATLLAAGLALLAVSAVAAARTTRARPLPLRLGWRTWVLIVAAAAGACAAIAGVGVALRATGAPLPFTIASLLAATVLALLPRWSPRLRGYVHRVVRDEW